MPRDAVPNTPLPLPINTLQYCSRFGGSVRSATLQHRVTTTAGLHVCRLLDHELWCRTLPWLRSTRALPWPQLCCPCHHALTLPPCRANRNTVLVDNLTSAAAVYFPFWNKAFPSALSSSAAFLSWAVGAMSGARGADGTGGARPESCAPSGRFSLPPPPLSNGGDAVGPAAGDTPGLRCCWLSVAASRLGLWGPPADPFGFLDDGAWEEVGECSESLLVPEHSPFPIQ